MTHTKLVHDAWHSASFRYGYNDARAGTELLYETTIYQKEYLLGYELGEQHKFIELIAKLNTDAEAT